MAAREKELGPLEVPVEGSLERAISRLKAGSWPLVLTPHPGEAARLLEKSTSEIQLDRLGAARELAAKTGAVVILKGHRSIVASPDGHASINSSGNPGMATGGMGDVLTGIVGAYLARGMDVSEAARLATFVHGDAGDRSVKDRGQEALIASDLLERLPHAIEELGGPGESRTW